MYPTVHPLTHREACILLYTPYTHPGRHIHCYTPFYTPREAIYHCFTPFTHPGRHTLVVYTPLTYPGGIPWWVYTLLTYPGGIPLWVYPSLHTREAYPGRYISFYTREAYPGVYTLLHPGRHTLVYIPLFLRTPESPLYVKTGSPRSLMPPIHPFHCWPVLSACLSCTLLVMNGRLEGVSLPLLPVSLLG